MAASKVSIIVFMILVVLSTISVTATTPSLNYVYAFDDKGLARVTVIISNLTGFLEFSFPVYEQIINESLIAFDENGDIVLANYNGTHITVYPYNNTGKVLVQFNAITGTLENNIITGVIHPYGSATVTLPDNAGLLYFNDTPEIEIIGNTIKLHFNKSAGYEIQYVVVNVVNETTTGTSPTTTTMPTTMTTTTTASVPTTREITKTRTITTSPTNITQTSSPRSTTSTLPLTTQTSTTTANASSTSTTTTPSGGAGFPTIVVVFIVTIIVLLILGYILYKMKFGKLGGSGQQVISRGGGREPVIKEPGSIDERDRLILEKIADKTMSISELARETGLSKSTVWRRVRKLAREGYVMTRDEGKYTYVEITDKGRSAVDVH